jgi:IS605 OrfB family transposase
VAAKIELPTTQRAYTLRLRGVNKADLSWRDALWATHEAVNRGAKVFGDWLLTLRGGLDHSLAEDGPPEQRKDRRILLALSWLTVEDQAGTPSHSVVKDPVPVLRQILNDRGVSPSDIGDWLADCSPSLQASIRPDAVWVNRSAAFDSFLAKCPTLTRDEIWDFLEPFFVSPKVYLQPAEKADDDPAAVDEDEAKDLVQKAGGWLSRRMGSGTGADFARMAQAYEHIAAGARSAGEGQSGAALMRELAASLATFEPTSNDADGVLSVISGPGYKSATRNHIKAIAESPGLTRADLDKLAESATTDARNSEEKVGGKGPRPYSDLIIKEVERACGFTYLNPDGRARHPEFSVMLDHAARRVNVAHSWIKNAEAERRQFEDDAQRIAGVPPQALAWLEAHCEARKGTSGALDAYRIRKRAIDGWDKVVARWSRADCRTTEDRIKAARELQDDPEIDKFGDIQLFEALADDDAECVWKSNGKPAAEPLKNYVFARDAMAKRLRFKVPAYRHPDPLRHPVFVDFGNSRWDIEFSAHRAPTKLKPLADKEKKLRESLAEAEEKLATASDKKRPGLIAKTEKLRGDLEVAAREHASMADRHSVRLRLWNGQDVEAAALRWSSKRLMRDLALRPLSGGGAVVVTRADRLGRAAAGVDAKTPLAIAGLFDEGEWNGRLQAPRKQLDAIARQVEKNGWDSKAETMRQRIHWLLSFSAKLTPRGPWTELAARLGLKPDPQYWPHADANKKRKSHARLILSRLPGLRVLSVDLGHRFAAACAVWQSLSLSELQKEITGRKIVAGGIAQIDLYCHTRHRDEHGKERTTIYRRIGADTLLDGSIHPSPWARLDRQFLIKLQGEDRSPRKASPQEIQTLSEFERCAGRERRQDEPRRSLSIDDLMYDAVRTARLALQRHARRARIAFNLTTDERVRPGGIKEALTEEKRLELLVDVLGEWHALATDSRWNDQAARELWNDSLSAVSGGFEIQRQEPSEDGQPTKAERKKAQEELAARLKPLAGSLADDRQLATRLHDTWEQRWKLDDEQWRGKLKWLSRWLMPHGGGRSSASRRNVGGLSLSRISTLVDFRRKVQVGFFTRMKPDGTRVEIDSNFGQKALDLIERLKDSRTKQLVSRIVEAALGAGTERGRRWTDERGKERDRKRNDRPYWIDEAGKEHGDRRFAPCHAIIIEDLDHYRPEETRTRRENRQTMDWKSAETRKRLADHCQLYGLHLRDVNPQYTSRQDSRTGAPGMRCVEVQVEAFLNKPLWQKQVAQAHRKREDGKGDSRDMLLFDLYDRFKDTSGPALKQLVCLPLKGGDLFTSAQGAVSRPIQADLNAAANIGLRALMDPDFPGRWWYVPCDPKTKSPKADKVKGSILDAVDALAGPSTEDGTGRMQRARTPRGKPKDVVNLWRDSSLRAITGVQSGDAWQETPQYWNTVQARVVALLREAIDRNPLRSDLPF